MIETKKLIKSTFEIYKSNFKSIQEVLFLFLIATFGYQMLNLLFISDPEEINLVNMIVSVAYIFLSFWVEVILISLIYLRMKKMPYKKELVYRISLIILSRYIWVKIIYFALIVSGGVLFIVPGILVFILFTWAPYLVALEGRKVMDSFKDSVEIVKKYWKKYIKQWLLAILFYTLVGFGISYLLIYIMGSIFKDLDAVFIDPLNSWPAVVISMIAILFLPCYIIIQLTVLEELKLVKAKEVGVKMNKEEMPKMTSIKK